MAASFKAAEEIRRAAAEREASTPRSSTSGRRCARGATRRRRPPEAAACVRCDRRAQGRPRRASARSTRSADAELARRAAVWRASPPSRPRGRSCRRWRAERWGGAHALRARSEHRDSSRSGGWRFAADRREPRGRAHAGGSRRRSASAASSARGAARGQRAAPARTQAVRRLDAADGFRQQRRRGGRRSREAAPAQARPRAAASAAASRRRAPPRGIGERRGGGDAERCARRSARWRRRWRRSTGRSWRRGRGDGRGQSGVPLGARGRRGERLVRAQLHAAACGAIGPLADDARRGTRRRAIYELSNPCASSHARRPTGCRAGGATRCLRSRSDPAPPRLSRSPSPSRRP